MNNLISKNNDNNNENDNNDNTGVHIVIVIDLLVKPRFDNTALLQCLNSILTFGNSFLMQSGYNKLTILGSNAIKNSVLYFDRANVQNNAEYDDIDYNDIIIDDQQNEQFAIISKMFRKNFLKWTQECSLILNENFSNDHQMDNFDGQLNNQTISSLLSGSLSQALCLIHSFQNQMSHSRIVVFSIGTDYIDSYSSQYMKLINCFFAAQKINVLIDACSINLCQEAVPVSVSLEEQITPSVLQQGCDLTGGRYMRIHKVASILQYLFWCLTPSLTERQQYVLPPKYKIAPPAACFCHRKPLEFGFVCSVCLSIFCQFMPFCSTCNSNLLKSNLNQIANLKNNDSNDITNHNE